MKLGAPSADELGFAKSLKVAEIGGTHVIILEQVRLNARRNLRARRRQPMLFNADQAAAGRACTLFSSFANLTDVQMSLASLCAAHSGCASAGSGLGQRGDCGAALQHGAAAG